MNKFLLHAFHQLDGMRFIDSLYYPQREYLASLIISDLIVLIVMSLERCKCLEFSINEIYLRALWIFMLNTFLILSRDIDLRDLILSQIVN